MAKKNPTAKPASVPVDAHKHPADKRPNIPTRETAAFAADDGPQSFVVHRDRSLDPQLVWKGKDEQDAKPLEVPAVALHVQEKVHPRAIVEDVKARAKRRAPLADLFSDFNGLDDFQKKLEFYQHDQHWTNRLILGDSLLVMASLAEKERLRGQVQCVYFDPPYGIRFGSNWQVSTRKRDVKDAKAEDLTRQPEQIKAFRDTWELGIHSYLSYLRDRLAAARDLLTESGSIFVQISDENVHLVRSLLDEVFGSDNFASLVSVRKTGGLGSGGLTTVCDYIVWYYKNREQRKFRSVFLNKLDSGTADQYGNVCDASGTFRSLKRGQQLQEGDRLFQPTALHTMHAGVKSCLYEFTLDGKIFRLPPNRQWSTTLPNMMKLAAAKRIFTQGATPRFIRYLDDFPVTELTNIWSDLMGTDDKTYVVQTASKIVERCILMATDPGDLVLDPTCGSGTTAYVAEQWGRRWITIDTSRVALALARSRLMAARFPYYLLADSPEGRKKQAELTGTPTDPNAPAPQRDMHKGFVYRTVPHVTLKSIANNPDIQPGMTREQIDQAIAKHADTETLYDQPYEDKNVVRLTGPFTVESLSPHRSLPAAPAPDATAAPAPTANFGPMILDNLRKAGVKGTDKKQRITFTRLDNFPGEHIHAEGETDTGAAVRVCVGPEFGTLGDADIKKAALEAIKGSKCDLLLVLRVRVRGECPRADRGTHEGDQTRQAGRAAGADEPGPGDGRRTAEEDRGRQPVHRVRRAGPETDDDEGRQGDGHDPRRGRVRPQHGGGAHRRHRRHRVLVHRHGLRRPELFRAARLLPVRRQGHRRPL